MEYKNVYFLGIGGIGMSALARYFLHGGYAVAGRRITANTAIFANTVSASRSVRRCWGILRRANT